MGHVKVVAEIGQNHNGSEEMARALIEMAADPRPHELHDAPHYSCDAVKLTVRDLAHEGTVDYMAAEYGGPNSFGATYGAHRAMLELERSAVRRLSEYAHSLGLEFWVTLCHPSLVYVAERFRWNPDCYKVASRDIDNVPLLRALPADKPVAISLGLAKSFRAIGDAILHIRSPDITVMHCTSSYPVPWEDVNLNVIPMLASRFKSVGFSDHTEGFMAAPVAVALGATVIEKHVTLDRTLRGSDQRGSLDRGGLYKMLRDIRHVEQAMGSDRIRIQPSARPALSKLARSLAWASDLTAGQTIKREHLELLSPGIGIEPAYADTLIGKTLKRDVEYHRLVAPEDIA